VRRGLVGSREQAQHAIAGGLVLVGGAPAMTAARLVGKGEPVRLLGPAPRFASRGGDKLDAALTRFEVAVRGARALDAGASTGGFTDCLLQRGAGSVTALDVGHGQLHPRLRADARVHTIERANVRNATPEALGGPFGLIVADLSFISLRTVAGVLAHDLAEPGADLVVLVKPQFESGRQEASRGKGVIRDPQIWGRVLEEVRTAFSGAGAAMMGVMVSPLRGAEGNVEFLMHLRVQPAPAGHDPGPRIAAAVAEASAMGDTGG